MTHDCEGLDAIITEKPNGQWGHKIVYGLMPWWGEARWAVMTHDCVWLDAMMRGREEPDGQWWVWLGAMMREKPDGQWWHMVVYGLMPWWGRSPMGSDDGCVWLDAMMREKPDGQWWHMMVYDLMNDHVVMNDYRHVETEREREWELHRGMWVFYVSVPAFHPVFCRGTRRSVRARAVCVCVQYVWVQWVCVCTVNVRKGGCVCSKCVRGGRVHSIQDSFSCRNWTDIQPNHGSTAPHIEFTGSTTPWCSTRNLAGELSGISQRFCLLGVHCWSCYPSWCVLARLPPDPTWPTSDHPRASLAGSP